MLVVLFGPSGVGKTSLSRLLARDVGYQPLVTYTTRKPRIDEDDRRSVTDVEYGRMVSAGKVVSTSQVLSARYGLDSDQLRESLLSMEDVYVVDFALENLADIDAFQGYKIGVLVMPPSKDELTKRLIGRGNGDRVDFALQQLAICDERARDGLPELIEDRVVVNDSLSDAGRMIQQFVERKMRRRGGAASRGSAFLSDIQILRALESGEVFERGTWSKDCVHQASYGLRLDRVAQVSTASYEAEHGERRYTRVNAKNGFIDLAPGDTALLQSVERFDLVPHLAGLVIPRGLLVANSLAPGSSYVDPGFKGFFTMPVTNVSGRTVRLTTGMEAARVMFAELGHIVARPWSAADATSLRADLEAFPSHLPISREEVRAMRDSELVERIRRESPTGLESAEVIDRTRRAILIVGAGALVWPIAVIVANGVAADLFQTILGDGDSLLANIVANLVAALVTSGVLFLIGRFAWRRGAQQ
ncbi:dCTP deaminase domain-containing protein [Promicromonospora sp. CA-289599]|uniref:dCTP deaminase domain-containing protein n=1 Tax=Promicromonospora sp. CA-289599 TaxID=3240014 RepID=UPI003D8D813C